MCDVQGWLDQRLLALLSSITDAHPGYRLLFLGDVPHFWSFVSWGRAEREGSLRGDTTQLMGRTRAWYGTLKAPPHHGCLQLPHCLRLSRPSSAPAFLAAPSPHEIEHSELAALASCMPGSEFPLPRKAPRPLRFCSSTYGFTKRSTPYTKEAAGAKTSYTYSYVVVFLGPTVSACSVMRTPKLYSKLLSPQHPKTGAPKGSLM